MKKYRQYVARGLYSIFLVTFLCGSVLSAEYVTLSGTVGEGYQIVTDDETVYELGNNEVTQALMEHVGKRVLVTGMVWETSDIKVITVTSYEILE